MFTGNPAGAGSYLVFTGGYRRGGRLAAAEVACTLSPWPGRASRTDSMTSHGSYWVLAAKTHDERTNGRPSKNPRTISVIVGSQPMQGPDRVHMQCSSHGLLSHTVFTVEVFGAKSDLNPLDTHCKKGTAPYRTCMQINWCSTATVHNSPILSSSPSPTAACRPLQQ